MRANNFKDLTGEVFGCFTVLGDSGDRVGGGKVYWDCRCECGLTARRRSEHLRKLPKCRHRRTWDEPGRSSWEAMLTRCYNVNSDGYLKYGFRGIKVCERWRNSFRNFISDMGPRPSRLHTIDRWPDQSGDYEPGNCRWALAEQQNRNKRNNVFVEYGGERRLFVDVPRADGVSPELALARLKLGWPIERAISQAPRPYTPRGQPNAP